MRKLAVTGALAALALGAASGSQAATQSYNITGTLANSTNSCFNIAVSLTGTDCSYARTRSPANATVSGPKFASGFYSKGSVGDNLNYIPVSGDGKASLTVTGTAVIDDSGTPLDGADDLISVTWVIAGGVQNVSTGNGDRAIERWDSLTHVMAATPVNAATANGGGGFTYRIGSRGTPTPAPLCAAANPSNCFPSENAPATLDPPGFWDTTFSQPNPATNRNGIERSPGFGLFGAAPLNPNVGGQTTGTFVGYECIDAAGDNDCTVSESMFGSGLTIYRNEDGTTALHPTLGNCNDGLDNDGGDGADALDPQCEPLAPITAQPDNAPQPVLMSPPGFENVILLVTTNGQSGSAAQITAAQAYWTREYVIKNGPAIGTDAAGVYSINNSYGAGRIVFTGEAPQSFPTAVDDDVDVTEDTATNIAVLANDSRGEDPNTVTIVAGEEPANGTAVVNGENVVYTPDLFYSGPDTFQYRVTDQSGDTSIGTVTITVSEKVPTAGNFNASSRNGAPSAAVPVLGSPTVLGSGTAGQHTVTVAGAATGGTCAVSGSAVVFTPAAGFNGPGSCDFEIEDGDGDSDVGTLSVSVSGNSGGGGGGGGGPQLPSGGSSLGALNLLLLVAGLPLLARRRRVAA
jgi:hypothetical protein